MDSKSDDDKYELKWDEKFRKLTRTRHKAGEIGQQVDSKEKVTHWPLEIIFLNILHAA